MRDFLDAILDFIESESLTDDEFATVDEALDAELSAEVYSALRTILEARDNVSGQVQRLTDYFTAAGVDVSQESIPTPTSNILVGGPV